MFATSSVSESEEGSLIIAQGTQRGWRKLCVEKQYSGSLHANEADRERRFEIFSKAVRRITN